MNKWTDGKGDADITPCNEKNKLPTENTISVTLQLDYVSMQFLVTF